MANAFKSYKLTSVGTTATNVVVANAATETVIIGMSLSNTTANSITGDVFMSSGANSFYIVKNAPIPVGSTLIVVGGDQKVVLPANDIIKVASSANSSIDVVLSALEIT